jgi:hypothetical protein
MIGVALISILIYIYIITQTVKKVKKDVSKKFLDSKKEELIKEAEAEAKAAADAKRISLEHEYRTLEQSYKDQINRTKNEINYLEQNRNNIINHEKETIKFAIDSYKKAEETKIEYEINQKRNTMVAQFAADHNKLLTDYEEQKELLNSKLTNAISELTNEVAKIKLELDDYQKRRAAVNEAILREKELKEHEEFYRIVLTQADIEDLTLLKELTVRFHQRDFLNKAAYECYIKKPLLEMTKRILTNRSISGIYKITYLKTGEAYIGKSTDIGKRWTEHAKSVFGVGTIAHALVHTRMARDGIWNFTWEVIEEVPKEKLNEREKYWIEFYETKKMGMNEKGGG